MRKDYFMRKKWTFLLEKFIKRRHMKKIQNNKKSFKGTGM